MFELLLERRMHEYRDTAGVISATVANAAPFVKRDRALGPKHFFPDWRELEEEKRAEAEKQIRMLEMVFGCGPSKPGTFDPKSRTVH